MQHWLWSINLNSILQSYLLFLPTHRDLCGNIVKNIVGEPPNNVHPLRIYPQTCGLTSGADSIPPASLSPVGLHQSCPVALPLVQPHAPWQHDGEQLLDAVPCPRGKRGAYGCPSSLALSPETHAGQLWFLCSLYSCCKNQSWTCDSTGTALGLTVPSQPQEIIVISSGVRNPTKSPLPADVWHVPCIPAFGQTCVLGGVMAHPSLFHHRMTSLSSRNAPIAKQGIFQVLFPSLLHTRSHGETALPLPACSDGMPGATCPGMWHSPSMGDLGGFLET